MPELFIGVDGGGSKTVAYVIDSEARLLGEGRGGPGNHLRVGIDAARREIEAAILSATRSAGIDLSQVAFTYCGVAGSDHREHREVLVRALARLFPEGNYTVDTDARIALTAAIGFGPGIVVISGTGSVAFGRNSREQEARAGGWGPTLGDEGSGYAISRRGLSAIVRAHDGRGPATLMTELLCSDYDMCAPDDLPRFVYAPTTHADDIARYVRMVISAALQGDEVAKHIFENEGRELGRTVAAVAARLGMNADPFPVGYVGGAFNAGGLLMDPMKATLLETAPLATLHAAQEHPAMGAARLAVRNKDKRIRHG